MTETVTDHEQTCIAVAGPSADLHPADSCPFLWRHEQVDTGRHVHEWVGTRWDGRDYFMCACGAARPR